MTQAELKIRRFVLDRIPKETSEIDFIPGCFYELHDMDLLRNLINKYRTKMRILGRGAYGYAGQVGPRVYRVVRLPPNNNNNEKTLATFIEVKKRLCENPVLAMSKKILPLFSGFFNLEHGASVEMMPYMEEGTLHQFGERNVFEHYKKRTLWRQFILDGYEALDFPFQRFHVAHCDISEHNAYVKTNPRGTHRLVIGDFDCVRKPRTISLDPIGADRTGTVPVLAFMSDKHESRHCMLLSRSSDYYLLLCSVSSALFKCNFLQQVLPPSYVAPIRHASLKCCKSSRYHAFPCTYPAAVLTTLLADYDSLETVVVKLLGYYGGSPVTVVEDPIYCRTFQALMEGVPVKAQGEDDQTEYPGSWHFYVCLQNREDTRSFQTYLVYLTEREREWCLVKKTGEAAATFPGYYWY